MYIQEISFGNNYPGRMRIFQRNPFGSTPGQWESDQTSLGTTWDTIFGIYVTDTIAPKVDVVNPVEGTESVERTINVTATFSERMDPDTLNTTTFKLFKVNKNGATSRITDAPVRILCKCMQLEHISFPIS